MAAYRFSRYELRTTDMVAARAFYMGVFGTGFWDGEVSLGPLPERAVALGAPSHWLGHIAVGNPEETAARIVALGAERLGPTRHGDGGTHTILLRDPFGAIVAATSEAIEAHAASVAWHLHHSVDHERAFALYAGLFGWTAMQIVDPGPQMGCHRMFAWDESGRPAGSMANTARLAQVHPQWLFFFAVADITQALAGVRAHGGMALDPIRTSTGDIAAPCNDPQGAAFGLYQIVAREG